MKPVNSIDIIGAALRAYAQRAPSVLGASLIINGGGMLLSMLAINALGVSGWFLYGLILAGAQQLTAGAAALLMTDLWTDREPRPISELVQAVGRRTIGLMLVAWLYAVVTMIGFLLLIIPGILFGVWYSVAGPALLIRRVGVIDAFNTSKELTRQAFGSVWLVVLITNIVVGYGPSYISNLGGDLAPLEVLFLLSFVASTLLSPFQGLATGELYLRLAGQAAPVGPPIPAPTGAWVGIPQPAAGMPGAAPAFAAPAPAYGQPAAFSPATAAVPAPYGTPAQPAQPYGASPQPYGSTPQPYGSTPQPYGAPPQPYGSTPQPYGAPPQAYGSAPQPYGAPTQPQTSQPYGSAPQPYGAPAQHYGAAPAQPYGAAPAQPYGAPPQSYGAPAQPQAAQPYGAPAQPYAAASQAPQPYAPVAAAPTAAASPAAPGPGAPGIPPAAAPSPYGAAAAGGPGPAPVHPGRERSVAPPGMG